MVQWHEGALLLSAGEVVDLDVQNLEPDVLAKQEAGWQAPGRQELIAEEGRRMLVMGPRIESFFLGREVPGIEAFGTD